MAVYQEEDALEILNNIFLKCDVNERGAVDLDTLITFLTSQDQTWQGDKGIEDEIRKLLCCNNSTQVITQSYFTTTLLNWFKTEYGCNQETKEDEYTLPAKIGEKCSSLSSGIGEEEVTPSGSLNSIEDHYSAVVNFDGESFSSEDRADDIEDRENIHSHDKLVQSLEDEVSSLHRRNKFLEDTNNSLISQLSQLRDDYEKEKSAHLKKAESYNQLVEDLNKKEEEFAEKLNLAFENKKSVTVQLTQYERENSKLEELIEKLDKQVDTLTIEKADQKEKIQKLQETLNCINDLHNKSVEDIESLKHREQLGEKALEDMSAENKMLNTQLESNAVLIQDLKTELSNAYRKLSTLQIDNIESTLDFEDSLDDSLAENSMLLFDSQYSLDDSIPLESSLLAELKDKAYCYKCEHISLKNQPFPFNLREEKSFRDGATMTCKEISEIGKAVCKDVGINCSIKNAEIAIIEEKDFHLSHLSSKRSLTKWITLGVIVLVFIFLLGFVSSSALTFLCLLYSPRHLNYLSSIHWLPVTVKYSNVPI